MEAALRFSEVMMASIYCAALGGTRERIAIKKAHPKIRLRIARSLMRGSRRFG
jgi:hypothetical protein